MLIDGKESMRPEIPKPLVAELEEHIDKFDVKLYELGGYNSKGEFIRAAVREKIERQKQEYLE